MNFYAWSKLKYGHVSSLIFTLYKDALKEEQERVEKEKASINKRRWHHPSDDPPNKISEMLSRLSKISEI